jgi:hypothetical protein
MARPRKTEEEQAQDAVEGTPETEAPEAEEKPKKKAPAKKKAAEGDAE